MLDSCVQDWDDLEKEFLQLQEEHRIYCQKVEEVKAIQKKCMTAIAHQRYCTKQISDNLAQIPKQKRGEDVSELEKKIV